MDEWAEKRGKAGKCSANERQTVANGPDLEMGLRFLLIDKNEIDKNLEISLRISIMTLCIPQPTDDELFDFGLIKT